jgi:hypothetical protein
VPGRQAPYHNQNGNWQAQATPSKTQKEEPKAFKTKVETKVLRGDFVVTIPGLPSHRLDDSDLARAISGGAVVTTSAIP